MSNVRLTKKSMPSKTGGLSSNSGSDWPGHELDPVHQDLHRRRRDAHPDAVAVAAVDQLDGPLLREVRVGDQDLVDAASKWRSSCSSGPMSFSPFSGARLERDEPDGFDARCPSSASATASMCSPRADQHRAALVAGGAQQRAADASKPQRNADT